jgi:hypothetical protein
MCTVLLTPGVNVYCTTATGCQYILYYCHRVSMCTVLLSPGVNVYCATATGCQCILYYCHRVSIYTLLLPPGVNAHCTTVTECQHNFSLQICQYQYYHKNTKMQIRLAVLPSLNKIEYYSNFIECIFV